MATDQANAVAAPRALTTTSIAETPAIVARVMQRMQANGGIPALTRSVACIIDVLQEGHDDTQALVNAVLADVSLTQKVLRLANSGMYAAFGGNIGTVSQAIKILGVEAVGHLALGARLINAANPQHSGAENLPENGASELAQSLLAGSVANALTQKMQVADSEVGVVCSLLNRTGSLLAASFLPDEWRRIEQQIASGHTETEAASAELGIDFETLGRHVAEAWRLPVRIVQTLEAPGPGSQNSEDSWLFALTHFSNQAAAIVSQNPGWAAEQHMTGLAERYGNALGVQHEVLLGAARSGVSALSVEPALAHLLRETVPPESASTVQTIIAKPADALEQLRQGLRAVEQAVAENQSRNDVVLMALEISYTALGLDRIAMFLRDSRQKTFRVIAGLARTQRSVLMGISFSEAFSANVAHVALKNKADIYIENPLDEKITSRLPDWIRAHGLKPFFLLPMATENGMPFGLIFGQQAHAIQLSKEELLELKAMRDLLRKAYLK